MFFIHNTRRADSHNKKEVLTSQCHTVTQLPRAPPWQGWDAVLVPECQCCVRLLAPLRQTARTEWLKQQAFLLRPGGWQPGAGRQPGGFCRRRLPLCLREAERVQHSGVPAYKGTNPPTKAPPHDLIYPELPPEAPNTTTLGRKVPTHGFGGAWRLNP